ncbi:DUF4396 domain-containing protein [Paraburkholderia phytofirmans]|uniref:DUF4396 domain-containing protein n=1 Tax=Paraburkholderia phytofirmans TaxID=261302 RepID=A0ABW9BJ36_9BURK
MTHDTLDGIAKLFIGLSVASAAWVLVDIFLRGQRQHMKIMEAVWPLTMLYWGPLGLIFYYWFGRAGPARNPGHSKKPIWQATFSGASHCGSGCALGDFVGDWLAFGLSFTLFGSDLIGKMLIGFVLAYLFGIVFQYFSVAPMRGLNLMDGIVTAVKIDTLSLVAYEIGMFAWMTFRVTLYPDLQPTDWAYWLMMQVAMIVGFLTTYPVNWWLIRKGIKERM